MKQLFISLDVETFGPIPGKHPMVELGAAAYTDNWDVVDTFSKCLSKDKWESDSSTIKWWFMPDNYPNYQRIVKNAESPLEVMVQFSTWLQVLCDQGYELVPVAYPASFDYMFVYWYLVYYVGYSRPLSFSCLDIKSYICASELLRYREATKRNFPKRWFNKYLKHTHKAVDDALEQGWMFIQAYRKNNGMPLLNDRMLLLNDR